MVKPTLVPTIITIVGTVVCLAGIASWFALTMTFENSVHAAVTVTSKEDSGYPEFIDSKHEDARPASVKYTFFHVSNAAAVMANGAQPVFEERGPYVFTKHKKKLDVSFVEEGRRVQFTDRTYYEFDSGATDDALNPEADRITAFYPYYLATIGALAPLLPTGVAATEKVLGYAMGGVGLALEYQRVAATVTPVQFVAGAAALDLTDPAQAAQASALTHILFNSTTSPNGLVSANTLEVVKRTVGFQLTMDAIRAVCPTGDVTAPGCPISTYMKLFPGLPTVGAFVGTAYGASAFLAGVTAKTWATFNSPLGAAVGPVGTGILVSHTVSDWLYGFQDPLLSVLLPLLGGSAADAEMKFFTNQTSDEAAIKQAWKMTFETGKYNKSAVGQYVEYESKKSISAYTEEVPVRGTDGVINGMEISSKDTLEVFVTQIERPLKLISDGETYDIKGLDTYKFALDPSEITANPKLGLVFDGIFDITTLSSGVPIMLSKPRFRDADPRIGLPLGITPTTSDEEDSIVYLEPYTGRAIKANLRLQINVAVPGALLDGMNAAIGQGPFFNGSTRIVPILHADEMGELTDEDAKDAKDGLYGSRKKITIITALLCTVGAIAIVVGGIMCGKAIRVENAVQPYGDTDKF